MTRITDEEIAELRALLGLGTPRPWRTDSWTFVADADGEHVAITHVESIHSSIVVENQAKLIVAAVNALPRLLDRIEELESERAVNHTRLAANDARAAEQARRIQELETALRMSHSAWREQEDELEDIKRMSIHAHSTDDEIREWFQRKGYRVTW